MATDVAYQKTSTKGKDTRFFARISTADKALIEEAASFAGQSAATFVVSTAREAAERVIGERKVIRLNLEESRRLVEALLAPPKPPTKAFLKGLQLYRETVISDVNPNSAAVLAAHKAARKAAR